MDFFKTSLRKKEKNELTTEDFYLGSSEAEAESTNSKITLDEVFFDYLDILKSINHEKFIITGRKGVGKSAIGYNISYQASNNPNLFSAFIKESDINIEKIVQISKENDIQIQIELLYKWIILTKLLSLIAKNQKIQNTREYTHLTKFIDRNRGFINIKEKEILEEIKTSGFNIRIEYFKRLFNTLFNKELKIKEAKAPFYKLIPNLQDVIVELIKKDSDNKYVLVFDDLDIGFSVHKQEKIDSLVDLIRVTKKFNNDIFGANGGRVKIILLLRTDIIPYLLNNADTAKLFSSYAVEIKWYEDSHKDENKLKLKQFITTRLKKNYERLKIDIDNDTDVWDFFINKNDFDNNKTTFKYIIDHTFFRPRDIILLFNNISDHKFNLPLSKDNIHSLIRLYANEIIKELKNELSISFSDKQINNIFDALKDLFNNSELHNNCFSYNDFCQILKEKDFNDAKLVINTLFDYSIIGNMDEDKRFITFKFRDNNITPCNFDNKKFIIVHYILKVYFKSNK